MDICKLGDIAKFTTGKLNSNAAQNNGRYPFFTCAPESLRIDEYAFDTEAIILAGNNAEGNFHIQYFKLYISHPPDTIIVSMSLFVNIYFIFLLLFFYICKIENSSCYFRKSLNNFSFFSSYLWYRIGRSIHVFLSTILR